MSVQEILSTIKTLSTDEQHQLFDAFQAILPAAEIDAELLAEIERRSDELDQGKAVAIPWSEARDSARRAAGLE